MTGPRLSARWHLAWGGVLGAVVLLAGCAILRGTLDAPEEDEVPRPEWRVGDRWVFRRTSLSGVTTVVTHQVTAATGTAYTVRLTGLDEPVTRSWTADLHLAGLTAAGRGTRLEPPAPFFSWPLKLGKVWSATVRQRDEQGEAVVTHTWRVAAALDRVHTLAGSYYAMRIEHSTGADQRVAAYWYTPRVRYWVRFEHYLGGYAEELIDTSVAGR